MQDSDSSFGSLLEVNMIMMSSQPTRFARFARIGLVGIVVVGLLGSSLQPHLASSDSKSDVPVELFRHSRARRIERSQDTRQISFSFQTW